MGRGRDYVGLLLSDQGLASACAEHSERAVEYNESSVFDHLCRCIADILQARSVVRLAANINATELAMPRQFPTTWMDS
jgi:hypothetical protein